MLDLEKKVSALELEIESFRRRSEEELVRGVSAARSEGFSEGMLRGVQLCRQRLFLTQGGQAFLKALHTGLLEAYKKSALYVREMGAHIGHYASVGFKTAQSQAKAQGFTGSFDKRALFTTMTPSPHWHGDANESADHPFWLPVMRAAVQEIAHCEAIAPPLPISSDLIYDVRFEEVSHSSVPAETISSLPPASTTSALASEEPSKASAPTSISENPTSSSIPAE